MSAARLTARAQWLYRRLRVMGPAELAHRLQEAAGVHWLRRQQAEVRAADFLPAAFGFCASTERRLPALRWVEPSGGDPERLLDGHWPALGFSWRWKDDPAVWHTAPDTGRVWPVNFFAAIPYRQGNPVGDVRVTWEPARLQQLVALARLADARPEFAPAAAMQVQRLLRSWADANPAFQGVHYASSMECALRLLAVVHASDAFRSRLDAAHWGRVLRLVHGHATLIQKRLSLHSSLGNHTIAEAAGLFYAGSLFPEFPEATRWRGRGLELLVQEAAHQVLQDGGGVEQAFWYHFFVLDLLGLVDALLEKQGRQTPPEIRRALDDGRRFLAVLAPSPELLPRVGDADDGYALSPDLRISWDSRAPTPGGHHLVDSGYSVINAEGGSQLILDYGPLGMPPSYGHGHADALAVTFSHNGARLLIDPGTFTYNGAPDWRAYFRSTPAHNTVTVDHGDQADQASAFMWSRPFRAHLLAEECPSAGGAARLLAEHGAYGGVLHRRGVSIRGDGAVLIWDRLTGAGRHTLELYWHSECAWEKNQGGYVSLSEPAWQLNLEGGGPYVYRGSESPKSGWSSACYGRKTPITTLCSSFDGVLPHEFLTLLTPATRPWTHPEIEQEIAAFRRELTRAP